MATPTPYSFNPKLVSSSDDSSSTNGRPAASKKEKSGPIDLDDSVSSWTKRNDDPNMNLEDFSEEIDIDDIIETKSHTKKGASVKKSPSPPPLADGTEEPKSAERSVQIAPVDLDAIDLESPDRKSARSMSMGTRSEHSAVSAVSSLAMRNSGRIANFVRDRVLNPYGHEAKSAWNLDVPEEEQEMEQALSEDIYSLMSVSPSCSVSMAFALLIFWVQFLFVLLVALDLIDFSDNPRKTNGVVNRMGIPTDTTPTVRAAQFLGVLLIVNFGAGEGDLLEGFSHLLNGYDARIIKAEPHARRFKWYMAGVCQLLVGMGLTVDLFVLMMRSTSNIELCLNFAALHFVQDIDDVAFTMGSMGLINRRVQKDCVRTSDIMIASTKTRRSNIVRRFFLFCLTILLYALFFMIAFWQMNGQFMCHTLYVQFGDVWGPELPYYSGLFDTIGHKLDDRIEQRSVYVDSMTGTIKLAYCSGEEAWVFYNASEVGDDHCNYLIKSSTTTGYDILEVAEQPWYFRDVDLGDVPMDHLLMDCNDCNEQICAEDVGTCSSDKRRCICKDDRMGINCEFKYEDACDFIALDRRSKASLPNLPSAALFTRKEYQKYSVGNINQLYDRPFYVSLTDEDAIIGKGFIDVFIIFTGYRWIIYGVPQEKTTTTTLDKFNSYLEAHDPRINPLQTLSTISSDALPHFEPLFFSSPVKFETNSHEIDPINVHWVLAQIDESLPQVGAKADVNHLVSASFLCSKCHENNPCYNGGFCNETTCDCTNPEDGLQSYGGNMCEYAFSCIEFQERENRLLNGCECDPVFGICTKCDRGYYGNLCQFKHNITAIEAEIAATGGQLGGVTDIVGGHWQCKNATCLNGGYCTNIASACVCPEEYEGDNCGKEKWVCTDSTCKNGGSCSDTTEACNCLDGFQGVKCEVRLFCYDGTCQNGGQCSNSTSDVCVCPLGFEGVYCQVPVQLCGGGTCRNGGECSVATNSCVCPEGFDGEYCQVRLDWPYHV